MSEAASLRPRGERIDSIRPLGRRASWQVVPGVRLFSFYTFAVVCLRVLLRVLTRFEVSGIEHVPQEGPLVVISNHVHFSDPPIIGATIRRKVLLMAKRELFDTPILGWVVCHFDAFPVRRGAADRQAVRAALRGLGLELAIALFPEGTRSRDGRLRQALPGAALIAHRSGAPVLPIAIDGSDGIFRELRRFRRARVRVRIGETFTIQLDDKSPDRLERAMDQMMTRIACLLPPSRRGYYGDAVTSTGEAIDRQTS